LAFSCWRGLESPQSMTKPSQFYWQWLLRALRGKIGLAAFVSGLLALVAQPLASIVRPENEMIGWVPAVLFASAFIVLLLVGLGRAPYEMFSELEVEEQKLKDQLSNRERRQAAMARLWQLRAEGVNLP